MQQARASFTDKLAQDSSSDQGRTEDMQEDAKRLFHEAYESIERSGDLLTVTEVRIKILLLMVAGMCGKHGSESVKLRAENHLLSADSLRESLPKIGTEICTVFSHLSKRNESSETIHAHIELIRNDELFYWAPAN